MENSRPHLSTEAILKIKINDAELAIKPNHSVPIGKLVNGEDGRVTVEPRSRSAARGVPILVPLRHSLGGLELLLLPHPDGLGGLAETLAGASRMFLHLNEGRKIVLYKEKHKDLHK